MTYETTEDLNLLLLKGIEKICPFDNSAINNSVLALGLFEACKEIGFEKLPPKIVHLWLLTIAQYHLEEVE